VGAVGARESDVRRDLDALRLEIDELRASRRRLVLAADAERRGFERTLHDGLQQQLVGLAANLELAARSLDADPSSVSRLLAEMRTDLQEALELTRALALRIAPPLLDQGGLLVALRAAAAGANVPSRIDVAGPAFPPELAAAVYFCFVEVLGRAERDTEVEIAVWEEVGVLAFELISGEHVETEERAIRDRIEALGGSVHVRSEPGSRTVWSGQLPLP